MVLALLGILLAVPQQDTCIAFISQNLAKGNGNWFTYYQISDKQVKIREGDVFAYEVFLDPKNPVAKGGVDIELDSGPALRDRHPADQNGIDAHGDGILTRAIGKWYERKIPLDTTKGRTTRAFSLVFEGDKDGRYVQFID